VLLQFDLNTIQLQAKSGMDGTGSNVAFPGVSFTGSFHFSKAASSLMASVRVDSVTQNGSAGSDTFAGTLDSLDGNINFVNGQVQGGALTFTVKSGASSFDTYTTQIDGNNAPIQLIAGSKVAVATKARIGSLTDGNFAGVNVTPWDQAEPLSGEILLPMISFSGTSGAAMVGVEVSAIVPEPASIAAVGGLLAGGLLLRRRRA
jgi:hypothetical protein